MPAAWLPPMAISLPLLGSCVLLLLRRLPRLAVDVVATAFAAGLAVIGVALVARTTSTRVVTWSGGWNPAHGRSVGIVLVVDQAGAGLVALIAVLAGCALLYGWKYFADVTAHYHALLLLFVSGMVGYTVTGDLFDMFVFFELMGAAAYALAGFKIEESESVQGAFNFGVVNSLGAYLCLVGIGLLYARTGRLGLAQLGSTMDGRPADALVGVAFALIATGWLVKAAAVPFHFWLADAHAVAPTPVCVLFSGVMAPLGVYGLARVYWTVFAGALPAAHVHRLFFVVGVLTAAVGAVMCVGQRHIKRMLAYSTIAHIGLFLLGVSTLDVSGMAGSVLYLAGHAGVKAALFLLAGMLLARYGNMDEYDLHGRARDDRFSGVLFVLCGVALAGLPPFGTGLGKSLIEESVGSSAAPVAVAVSVFTAATVIRSGLRVYFGVGAPESPSRETTTGAEEDPEVGHRLRRPPVTMRLAVVSLVLLGLAVGAVPAVAVHAGQAASAMVDHSGYLRQVYGTTGAAAAPLSPQWTPNGALLGVLSTVVAVGLTAVMLSGSSLPRWAARAAEKVRPAARQLHRLHSGHIGDYVAFLALGAAGLAVLVMV